MADLLLCSEELERVGGHRLGEIAPDVQRTHLDALTRSGGSLESATLAYLSNDLWPRGAEEFFAALMEAPNLRWLHVMFAGTDAPIFRLLQSRGVRLTTSAGASAPAIAETVVMYVSALSRELPELIRSQPGGAWEWRRWRPLAGRDVAVVGYGPVGQAVAAAVQALGMRPTVVRRKPRGDEAHPARPLEELADVLAASDIVVLALPLNDDTHGIMSRTMLGAMRNDALFVNVGRGGLVDQAALTEALAAGRLGGAGLDVFEQEPLPAEDPLRGLPNVIVTPHNAGASTDALERVFDLFCDNLARWVRSEPLVNEVDSLKSPSSTPTESA